MVKRFVSTAAFCLLASALVSCGKDSHESLAKEGFDLTDEMVKTLEGVTDRASAEAAKPKLEKLVAKHKDLQKRMEALPKADAAAQKALEEKYQARAEELTNKMESVGKSLMMNAEVREVLGDTMEDMNK